MLITKKNRLTLSQREYECIKHLSHGSKNLYNVCLYNVKENYKETGKHLNGVASYKKAKDHKDYKCLPSDIAQQTIRILEQNYQSYFGLLKLKKLGLYDKPVFPPKFKKKDSHFVLQFPIRKNIAKTHFKIQLSKKLQEKFRIKSIKIERPEYISSIFFFVNF